jgi:dsDNA-specific endonuclease/ATPase MutS2
MIFNLGDKVRLLNEVGEGIVVEIISPSQIMVETDMGMALPFSEDDLLKLNDDNTVTYKKREVVVEKKSLSNSKRTFTESIPYNSDARKNHAPFEIDLHIEELVEEPRKLSSGEMLEIQIRHFRDCINEAIAFKISKLVVIHGVGEGILRQNIRTILRDNYPNIEFMDANTRKYGFGATEITIRNLHK